MPKAYREPVQQSEIEILGVNENQLLEVSKSTGAGLNLTEMKAVQKYFQKLKRNPTYIELQTIGQTWSEHCYHKTFKGKIFFNGRIINGLLKTYISKVAEEINAKWCFSIFKDNAGILYFNHDHGIAVKVETHNHPSAIEPFGGAATGVGGVIRDILGVWADPIACTDVLGFGPQNYSYKKLPQGIKHPRYVYMGVTAGIGNYGNNMGIPTVNGAIYYDESYVGNVVVFCGCIGLLPLSKFKKNAEPGNMIILAGGKTGRDGIHGVTFASAELNEKSEEISRPAVQIPNPIEEEKLKRAIIKIRDLELASAITDLGGGGLSSAIGETAATFNLGAFVNLEKVHLKHADLAPWEIYISESQERMLLAVPSENVDLVQEEFRKEEVEATIIGQFTAGKILSIYYQEKKIGELEIPFLFNPPIITRNATYKPKKYEEPKFPEPDNLTKVLLDLLSSPNIASKEDVVRTYDHEVKGNTVLKPLQGKYGGPNDASVIKPLKDSWMGLAISCGINPRYGKIDTYWMAASSIDEAIRNNVAVGGRRIALLDNFTWGNPENPETLGSLVKACEACYDFAKAYRTPFISGKDSLYNESMIGPVTPTLLVTAVGIVPDIRSTVSMDIKAPNNLVYIIGQTSNELGGSEYYDFMGTVGKNVPTVQAKEATESFKTITRLIDSDLIESCHDISEGGLGIAAAEMTLAGEYGLTAHLQNVPRSGLQRNDHILFSESNSRFLLEVSEDKRKDFESTMKGRIYAQIGKTSRNTRLRIHGLKNKVVVDSSISDLRSNWKKSTITRG
ncbi:MAG: phosphoribosylformylglycinamidine synthase subunit PurL [Candidatus Bathyarchaeota archaeon]